MQGFFSLSLFFSVFLGGDCLMLMRYLNFSLSIEIHQTLVVYVKVEPRISFLVFIVEDEIDLSASLFCHRRGGVLILCKNHPSPD